MDKTTKTIDSYNKHAVSYEKKFMNYSIYINRIRAFCDLLEPGASVLDVGCGPGIMAKQLVDSGKEFEILGIDLSPEMINRAKANVSSPRVQFTVGDIRNFSLTMNQFDAVVASFCLPHLTNEESEKLIEDISNVLRQGGLMYLSCMEGTKSGFETTTFSAHDDIFFNYYSVEYIEKVLSKNGLIITEVHRDFYPESDGSQTVDMFFFAQKHFGQGDCL